MSVSDMNRKASFIKPEFPGYVTNVFGHGTKTCLYRPPGLKKKEIKEELDQMEPPVLTHDENDQVFNYKKQKHENKFNLKECEAHLDGIKQGLIETKREIESIRIAEERIRDKIKTIGSRENLIQLNEEQMQLNRRLIILVDKEEKLMANLESQRRALAEARIKDQTFTLEMEDKIEGIYKLYEIRENFEYKRRVKKDQTIKKNCSLIRSRALRRWTKSIQNLAKQEVKDAEELKQKKAKQKLHNEKIQQYIRSTIGKRKIKKYLADADRALSQSRRYSNLINLRNRICDQNDVLLAEAKFREKRAKKRQELEDQAKQEMIKAGENPYIPAKIFQISKKQKLLEKQALVTENDAIRKIAEEFDREEQQRRRQEKSKEEWNQFWASLVRKRKREVRDKNRKFYTTTSGATAGSEFGQTTTSTALTSDTGLTTVTAQKDFFNLELLIAEQNKSPYHLPSHATTETGKEEETSISGHSAKTKTSTPEVTVPPSNEKSTKSEHRRKSSQKPGKSISGTKEKEDSFNTASNEEEEEEIELSSEGEIMNEHRRESKNVQPRERRFTNAEVPELLVSSDSQIGEGGTKNGKRVSILDKGNTESEGKSGKFDAETQVRDVQAAGEPFVSHVQHTSEKKEFQPRKGNAPMFKWTPEVILFQNFELGKTYKKRVTVTNISLQISKFYFKEVINDETEKVTPESTITPPEISTSKTSVTKSSLKKIKNKPSKTIVVEPKTYQLTDLVKVNFQIPQPISPGLSHAFTVTFTPQALGDWKGKLFFETPFENFFIPIQCSQSRMIPTLVPNKINFQHVVVGTLTEATVKLTNKGAKFGTISMIHKVNDSTPSISALDEFLGETAASSIASNSKLSEVDSKTKKSRARATLDSNPSKGNTSISLEDTVGNFISDILTTVIDSTFVVYVEEDKRKLEAGEHVDIKVHFHPSHMGNVSTTYEIQFEDPEIEVLRLELTGNGVENPIHVEPQHSNLKICLLDFNYQQSITISNSSKQTGKVTSLVLPALRPFVTVHPKDTILFPRHTAQFSVKFRPTKDLFTQPGIDEFYDSQTLIMDFPVYFMLDFPISMPGPLECTIQAIINESELLINPTEINFGICLTSETVKKTITIKNPSFVSQHLAFLDVPKNITIQPNHGFGTLLPSETRSFDILVSVLNEKEGEHQYNLKVQTLENIEKTISIKLVAKNHSVSLSHSRICFPVTCCGSSSSAIIEILSSAPPIIRGRLTSMMGLMSKFEFIVDGTIPIEIQPKSGYLEPGKASKILVNFIARVTDDEVKAYYVNLLEQEHARILHPLLRELEGINAALTALINSEEANQETPKVRSRSKSKEETPKARSKSKSNTSVKDTTMKNGPEPKQSTTHMKTHRKSHKKKNSLKLKSTDNVDTTQMVEDETNEILDIEEILGLDSKKSLRKRQTQLNKLIDQHGVEFIPPELSNLDMNSLEIVKAKRDLMQNLTTKSQAYTIPCIVTDPTGNETTLLLNVICPMQKADVILLDDASNIVNFGRVALGSKIIKEVFLHNISSGHVTLKMDIINPYGEFMRVNALRRIGPDQVFTLKLQFLAKAYGYFEDIVTITGGDSHIVLLLSGTAVKPEFVLTPNTPEVYIGNIEIKTLTTFKFEIQNTSDVELDFEIESGQIGIYEGYDFPPPEKNTNSSLKVSSRSGWSSLKQASKHSKKSTSNKSQSNSSTLSIRQQNNRTESELALKKKDRKKSTNSSHHSNHSKNKITSTYDIIPFEIQEVKDNITKSLTMKFPKLLVYLEEQNHSAYFTVFPKSLKLTGQQKGTFDIAFVPFSGGRYICPFNIKLFGQVVQNFSIVGIGFEPVSKSISGISRGSTTSKKDN